MICNICSLYWMQLADLVDLQRQDEDTVARGDHRSTTADSCHEGWGRYVTFVLLIGIIVPV